MLIVSNYNIKVIIKLQKVVPMQLILKFNKMILLALILVLLNLPVVDKHSILCNPSRLFTFGKGFLNL